jgi:cytochrome c556
MKTLQILVLLSAPAALATMASASDGGTESAEQQAKAETAQIDVDELVEGRRAAYWMSAGLFGGMFGVMNSGGDVRGLEMPARALAGWAKALPGMFPEGSVNEQSNALPTIWSDREKFNETAQLYAERATRLSEIAATGDAEAFKDQWAQVRETCASCHATFRRDRSES